MCISFGKKNMNRSLTVLPCIEAKDNSSQDYYKKKPLILSAGALAVIDESRVTRITVYYNFYPAVNSCKEEWCFKSKQENSPEQK